MEYFAHEQLRDDGESERQTIDEHCRNTARYAAQCLQDAGLSQAAFLAGLIHDAGKCKQEFQDYLLEGKGERGSVNHTFAGCRMILERFHGTSSDQCKDVTAELAAYAVGAHHGLFDCVDQNRTSGFLHRMQKQGIHYRESREGFLACCAGWDELETRFEDAHGELLAVYEQLLGLSGRNHDDTLEEFSFYLGLTARLLCSAVMEGDRRDTAEFMDGRIQPSGPKDWNAFWSGYLVRVEEKLAALVPKTPVQRARAQISDCCRRCAQKPGGVYRLSVPTGGGKTLSSLRFALAHAAQWGKKRVIFVTPLLAILEQNAKVIRDYIEDDRIILEHHSNVIQTEDTGDELDLRELAAESWHAPVILTTLAQLLNTFFLGKTTSVRRFQSLCGAVVVIDEVQSVPNHMLTLFNLTINFLSEICGTTFLLCSATQPCFEQADHPLVQKPADVVPFEKNLWEPFSRTCIKDASKMRLEEMPALIDGILRDAESLLVVCNKRSEAQFLYQELSQTVKNCFHLSASMCTEHRRDTLKQVFDALERKNEPVLCIATQVIEAGVDISFGRVIRLSAGMDSIVQAAGRCNRNGENPAPAPVYIVQCMDENLGNLQEIQRAKTATVALLERFRAHPQEFKEDLASDEAVRWYYRRLYANMEEGFQDYTLKEERDTLFSLLGGNTNRYTQDCDFYGQFTLGQAFRTAGERFQVFDENTWDVVVPYGNGQALIAQLQAAPYAGPAWLREWSRRAKPYTVSVYEYQMRKMGHVLRSVNGVLVLDSQAYDLQTGLTLETKSDFLEV